MMVADHTPIGRFLETLGAWLLGLIWMLPLLYAAWTAFHPAIYATHFSPLAPLTLANITSAWQAAPFTRYLLNTVMLVTLILAAQFALCTLAAFAFARLTFPGGDLLFAVVLLQLMVMPDVLLVENYRTRVHLNLADTASSACGRPSSPSRSRWRRRRGWRSAVCWRGCGGSMCRWQSPPTSPTAWSPSATTGTTSCGRWWLPTR
jgi:hypothetical protein